MTGAALREWRASYRLTQRVLGQRLGVSTGTVAHWEQGRQTIPSMMELALASVIRTTLDGVIQVPQSPFEQELFQAYLSIMCERWSSAATIVDDYRGHGLYRLRLFYREGTQSIEGYCGLTRSLSNEPVAAWSLPETEHCAQQNGSTFVEPVLNWV